MFWNFFKNQKDKRKYIRYPAETTIEYQIMGDPLIRSDHTKNLGFGGLCLRTDHPIDTGTLLSLKFSAVNPDFVLFGSVAWCAENRDCCEIGVEFRNENDAYRARILEEICHIKHIQR